VNNKTAFEWDEENIRHNTKHGIDFMDALDIFSDPEMRVYPDTRKDYGEERFNAYGISKGRTLRVCFTMRGDNIRIITMFQVHEKEWRKYYDTDKNNG